MMCRDVGNSGLPLFRKHGTMSEYGRVALRCIAVELSMFRHKAWNMASLPSDIYGVKRKRSLMYFFFVLLTVHLEYNRVKENKLDAHLILSIFHQSLHVSGVSRPMIRRHSYMYRAIGTYYSF
jgi:hypothetical protein